MRPVVRSRALIVASLLLLCASESLLAQRREPLKVKLQFIPEGDAAPETHASSSRRIRLLPLTDARSVSDKSLIGENQQRRHPIPVRATTSVAAFATDALRRCLSEWGVQLAADGELELSGELVTLFVVEANKYKGEARVRVRLARAGGDALWEGIAAADDFTWGRDLNPENYNQVLSDALKKAYASLVENPGFQKAWTTGSSATPPAEARPALTPEEAKATVLRLMAEGLGAELVAEYIASRPIRPPLTADEMVEWRRAGIPESVIQAAVKAGRAN